jgi:EspG family
VNVSSSVVLSALEFDVLWESERFPRRHVALDVPSPGRTHTERSQLAERAWASLGRRGLAENRRATPELVDQLALLASPVRSVDAWIWTERQISALAVASGRHALLGVLDGEEVWLIPARDSALAEAAVSVCGSTGAGAGRSVRVPTELLREADAKAAGDAERLVLCLERQGVVLNQAQQLAGMLDGMSLRGQFGAERVERDRRVRRAGRVVAFHDTPHGRYLHLVQPSSDGRLWSTIAPTDNQRLASCVWELLEEL